MLSDEFNVVNSNVEDEIMRLDEEKSVDANDVVLSSKQAEEDGFQVTPIDEYADDDLGTSVDNED